MLANTMASTASDLARLERYRSRYRDVASGLMGYTARPDATNTATNRPFDDSIATGATGIPPKRGGIPYEEW